jgi:GTP-binding protein EngB required for normal cell division
MDGSVDIKLLATIGGIVVSMAGAAAVAKAQIARLTEMLKDIETRMRIADNRTDKIENTIGTNEQRLNVIAKMMDPPNMERRAREAATVLARLEVLERTQNKIEAKLEKQ